MTCVEAPISPSFIKNDLSSHQKILLLNVRTILLLPRVGALLQEAGSMVNNTPLDEISCDPTEPFPVSPAKLLTLREDLSLKNEVYSEDDLLQYGKRRWRRCQFLADQFWQHWK